MKSCPFYTNQIVFVDGLGWTRVKAITLEDTGTPSIIAIAFKDNADYNITSKRCLPALLGVRVYRRPSNSARAKWQWLGHPNPLWFNTLPHALEYARKAACNRRNNQVKVAALEPETQSIFTLKHIKV